MDFHSEEDLCCSVCHDIFRDCVVLSCGHSFCKDCIQQWWAEDKNRSCPVCKRPSSRRDPPRNLVAQNLVESFQNMKLKRFHSVRLPKREDICRMHSEVHKLFCLNDLKPVCVVCQASKAHENHQCKPIDEAAQDLREKLQKTLKPLQNTNMLLQEFKENCDLSLAHIKAQSRHTERQIQDQFKKLHQFLLEEEEARMKALREEEELKTQRMKDKMVAVSREIEALSETIRATEGQLRASDVCFLHKYKDAFERVQRCPLLKETQLGPGALIDQAKHLGNLAFNIWANMKRLVQYTPVILDPNTAHPELVLSDDLTSIKLGDKQQLPLNPERVKMDEEVVRGFEGLISGSLDWNVEVGDSTDWKLGVSTDTTFYIMDNEVVDEDIGWWSITFSNGEYKTLTSDKKKDTVLRMRTNPRRIRLHLDCTKHKLNFYDPDTNTRIHSFTQIHQEKLFPIFVNRSDEPITILPQKL